MRAPLTLLAVLLVACAPDPASGPEGTPVEPAIVAENWAATAACVGVSAEPPRVLWNTEVYIREQTGLPTANAYYNFPTGTVVVPPDWRAMHHEMVHHLLRAAGVPDADNAAHRHPMFTACGYSFTIFPPGTVTPDGRAYPQGRAADGGPYGA